MFRIILFLVAIIVFILGAGYWYYKDSQNRIEILRVNSAKLEAVSKVNQQTIDAIVAQNNTNQQKINELSNRLRIAERYNNELQKLLQKHNLTLLAEQKPGLIEKRINDATYEVFDSIMRSTRSR